MSYHQVPRQSHDGAPLTTEWKEEDAGYSHTRKGRGRLVLYIAVPLTVLATILLLLLRLSPILGPASIPKHGTGDDDIAALGASVGDLKIILHPEDHLMREANVIRFTWKITKSTISPDGVDKDVYLINDQFPGPTIEARSGDTLEVQIINLLNEDVSFHWHGLHMRGANDMDGPVGITQCAISSGKTMTYSIPTNDQAGTFWYHAHSEVQRGDGLYGGLIIHNPSVSELISYNYDEEILFMIGDWYHKPSKQVLADFMSITSEGLEPCPDSLLINGHGYFDCAMATPASPVNCTAIEKRRLVLNNQKRYRVRVINVGSLTGFTFASPCSELRAIQVDGGLPIVAESASSIGVLYPAERVDFILTWAGSAADSDWEIIIQIDKEYFQRPNFALTPTQTFTVHTDDSQLPRKSAPVIAKPHRHGVNSTQSHFDLRTARGLPLVDNLADIDEERKYMIYTVVEVLAHQNSIPKGFINHTTWEPQATPLLTLDRSSWDFHQLIPWTGSKPAWVELTINNIDATGHPFHLHGFDFYVVSSYEGKGGWDYYNPFNAARPPRGGPFNLIDPIRKDTVYVPPFGYVVIRFLADNEGIWALHCHIMWHQASGMTMAFHVLGDEKGLASSMAGERAKQFCAA